MAYEIQTTEEQPKKSLKLKTIKLNVPKSDYLAVIIILLLLADIISLLLVHSFNEGITGLLIGLTLYLILKREEKEPEAHQVMPEGRVSSKIIEPAE